MFLIRSYSRSCSASAAFWCNQRLRNPLQVALLKWGPNLTTTFPCGSLARGVAFDGANIWVANVDGRSVTKLRASDGALLGTFTLGGRPYGVAFDGANIWVAINSTDTR